ncbi:MAG: hypothetical protein ACRYGR_00470 [Janthinobacterium lividum]
MILKKLPSYIVDNTLFSVLYKGYSQSKSLRLRYTPNGKDILITGPKIFSQKKVDAFLKNSSSWLSLHKPMLLTFYDLKDGTIFPFFGEDLTLRYHQFSRKSVLKEETIFHIMNSSTDFKDQLRSWIKKESKLTRVAFKDSN